MSSSAPAKNNIYSIYKQPNADAQTSWFGKAQKNAEKQNLSQKNACWLIFQDTVTWQVYTAVYILVCK